MKLSELIKYFRDGGSFESFCNERNLDSEAEVIEVYAEQPITLESSLSFFAIEETEGQSVYESKGVTYHNLFDFYYFQDVIEEVNALGESPTNEQLAESLLSYAIHDA